MACDSVVLFLVCKKKFRVGRGSEIPKSTGWVRVFFVGHTKNNLLIP